MKKYAKQLGVRLIELAYDLGLKRQNVTSDLYLWKEQHQVFELDFHRTNEFRQSQAFDEETKLLFESFGFEPNQFAGKTILDVGSGSKLRGKFFKDAVIVAQDPLAERFLADIPWCDLGDASLVISQPAEGLVPKLVGTIDFAFSINVLDHCYNFPIIIDNIFKYVKPDGIVFLSFDSHIHASVGHPLILTKGICLRYFRKAGFSVIGFQRGFSPSFRAKRRRNGYDGSSDCLSFWLRK